MRYMICKCFSHSVRFFFFFLIMAFEVQNVLVSIKYNFFVFVAFVFGAIPRKSLPNPRLQRFSSVFTSKSFVVLVLTFI